MTGRIASLALTTHLLLGHGLEAATPQPMPAGSDAVSIRTVSFANGDVRLGGSLYLPMGHQLPAVVIMHGAGADSRDPYAPDAAMLAAGGVAAFIFDKRGTGRSSGDWRRSSLQDLMKDGLAAVKAVRDQPEVDAGKVGIFGISQGGWLAPFMAAGSGRVVFLVQVTASATPLANQEMWGQGHSLKTLGFSDRAIAMTIKASRLLYSSRGLIRRGILPLGNLWFVSYDPTLDPVEAWPQVDVPALLLFGAKDTSVPTETSVNIIEAVWKDHGHPANRMVVFPERGHALGGASRNKDAAYAKLVTGWIRAVTQGTRLPDLPHPARIPGDARLAWPGPGADPTPWYGTAHFQLPLMVGFLLVFCGATVISWMPWVRLGGRLPRLVIGLLGLNNACATAGSLFVLAYLLDADATSASPQVPMGGWLFVLAWAAVAGALGATHVWVAGRHRSRLGSLVVAMTSLAAWLFVPFLAYWGLLAGPF